MTATVTYPQRDTRNMSPEDAARTYYLRMPVVDDMALCVMTCAEQLELEHNLTFRDAINIALIIYAEQRSYNCTAYIDVELCTRHLMVIKTATSLISMTIRDLMLMIRDHQTRNAPTLH